jgi:uncharacterized protein (DUF302 family)
MAQATQKTIPFNGTRVQVDTYLGFDEVLQRLGQQTGKSTVPEINQVATNSNSAEDFEKEVTHRFVGPSGFMLFARIDHGTWIAKYGINRRVLRIILGNPLLAVTMLREDISAGLFAPVEMLLVENEYGSTVYYVRPSSLMVVTDNPPLKAAALELDRKLELLIVEITGLGQN